MGRYFKASVLQNIPLNAKYRLLSLKAEKRPVDPLPGQFYMIGVSPGHDPLLKRAFSLFRKTPDGFQILYRIQGKGTSLLGKMKEGAGLDVLGPLGKPYPGLPAGSVPIIVAGGTGIASVFSLIEKLSGKASVFYGARSKDDFFDLSELAGLSRELVVSTDDGSLGEKGTVAELVKNYFQKADDTTRRVIYACGPRPMLMEMARIADRFGTEAYVSLEEYMACGLGACLGCAVEVKGKKPESKSYKKVCSDGPVFKAGDINWQGI